MSLYSRRRILSLGAFAALAACGFTPAYAPGGSADALRGRVQIAAPADRDGFDLVARLEDRLGRSTTPAYGLSHAVTTWRVNAAVTPDGAILRYTLKGAATFTLTDLGSGEVITTGRVESFTASSATGSTVATLTAEEDAARRLMVILADQIVTQLTAFGPLP